MNNKKIDFGRIALLVLLVGGLAASSIYMFRTLNSQSPDRRAKARAAQNAPPAQTTSTYDPSKPASSTNMPPVPGSKGAQRIAKDDGSPDSVNAGMFKVFGLNPVRNPFVRQEEWYKADLELLPGYPEMRDNGFLEGMENTVPLNLLEQFPGEHDWESVSVRKQQAPEIFNIEGTSEDGTITTSITASAKTEPMVDINWVEGSGIPLSELGVPGWEDEYDAASISHSALEAQNDAVRDAASPDVSPDSELPGLPDLSNGATGLGGALPTPGEMLNGGGVGDTIVCQGINLQEGRKSALIYYNGMSYIVAEGSVLPTRYQVLSINEDGVVLLELRDGSSRFVPLAAVSAPAGVR